MAFQLTREGIEDFPVEVTRGAIMLEDLNNAACLTNLGVLDDLFLEVCGAYLLDISSLLDLLRLIEVMKFAVKELFNESIQILAYLVEEDNFSVLLHI